MIMKIIDLMGYQELKRMMLKKDQWIRMKENLLRRYPGIPTLMKKIYLLTKKLSNFIKNQIMRNLRNNKIIKMIIISQKLMRILTLFLIIISTISIKTILKYLQSIWSIVPVREKKIFMMQIQVEVTLQGPGQIVMVVKTQIENVVIKMITIMRIKAKEVGESKQNKVMKQTQKIAMIVILMTMKFMRWNNLINIKMN